MAGCSHARPCSTFLCAAVSALLVRPQCVDRGSIDLPRKVSLDMGILMRDCLRFDISTSVPRNRGTVDLPHKVSLDMCILMRDCLCFVIFRPQCENRGTVDLPHKVSLDKGTLMRDYLRFDISTSV